MAGNRLVTMLIHSSGQFLRGYVALPTNLSPQELGSYLTYMRRYSYQSIIGVFAEEDDDGGAAQDASTKIKITGPKVDVQTSASLAHSKAGAKPAPKPSSTSNEMMRNHPPGS